MKKPLHIGHDDDGPDSPTRSRMREEALRPAPTLGYDWDALARHMLSIEALPVAEAQLRRAVWLNPFEWRFKQHLALCLYREKKYAEAKKWLLEVLRAQPEDALSLELLRESPSVQAHEQPNEEQKP